MSLDIIEKHRDEFAADADVCQIQLTDKLEKNTGINNKWLFILFQHRQKLNELKDSRVDLVINAQLELEEKNDSRYRAITSKTGKDKLIEQLPTVRKLDKQIRDQSEVVDHLTELIGIAKFTLVRSCSDIVTLRKLESVG